MMSRKNEKISWIKKILKLLHLPERESYCNKQGTAYRSQKVCITKFPVYKINEQVSVRKSEITDYIDITNMEDLNKLT